MRSVLAVLLAALLALAAAGAPAALPQRTNSHSPTADRATATGPPTLLSSTPESNGSAPALAPVVSVANTTNYLALPPDDVRTQRFGTATIDVSGALAADTGRLDAAFSRHRLRAAFTSADTEAERNRVLRRAKQRVASAVDNITARERTALAAYNEGELSTRQYLRTLAVLDARAEAIEGVVRELRRLSRRVDNPPVTEAGLASFKARLLTVQGPVRDHVGQLLSGERTRPERVYVETSSDGVVLAMVENTDAGVRYVREAYVARNRRPGATDTFGGNLVEVQKRLRDIYPWAFALANIDGYSAMDTDLRHVGVYRFTVNHDHGQLTTFFDGGTNTTFKEFQRKRLRPIPTEPAGTAVSDGLRLQANRTHTGGPLEVHVVDAVSGDPVNARITVDGTFVGRTGSDGRLWTIAPPVRFPVNATTADGTVSVDTFSRRAAG